MTNQVRYLGEIVTTRDYPALLKLYENRRDYGPNNRVPLECTKPHRGRMHLQMRGGHLWAIHYKGEGGPGCNTRIPEPEGPAHRHWKDYATRALESGGYSVTPEKYTTGKLTRPDLTVDAPFRFGVEAQLSPIIVREAKSRTTRSTRGGVPPAWIPGRKSIGDTLTGHVPVVRPSDDTMALPWESVLPRERTALAVGLRHITPEKCTASSRWPACPDTKRGIFCGNWHPWFNDAFGLPLDDALVDIGAGRLVLCQTRSGLVYFVPVAEFPIFEELTGLPGVFNPGGKTRLITVADDEEVRECTADRPFEDAESGWETSPDGQTAPLMFTDCL
jgi:hypothetical protein